MTQAIVRPAGLPLTTVALREPALRDLYEAGYAFIRPDRTVVWRGEGCGEAEAAVDAVCGAAGG